MCKTEIKALRETFSWETIGEVFDYLGYLSSDSEEKLENLLSELTEIRENGSRSMAFNLFDNWRLKDFYSTFKPEIDRWLEPNEETGDLPENPSIDEISDATWVFLGCIASEVLNHIKNY